MRLEPGQLTQTERMRMREAINNAERSGFTVVGFNGDEPNDFIITEATPISPVVHGFVVRKIDGEWVLDA